MFDLVPIGVFVALLLLSVGFLAGYLWGMRDGIKLAQDDERRREHLEQLLKQRRTHEKGDNAGTD